jgi:hypothetical protein
MDQVGMAIRIAAAPAAMATGAGPARRRDLLEDTSSRPEQPFPHIGLVRLVSEGCRST